MCEYTREYFFTCYKLLLEFLFGHYQHNSVSCQFGKPGWIFILTCSDVVNDNGNYYVFVSNNWPGGLVRLDFGNPLLNTPAVVNIGNVGDIIPNTVEGVQIVKNQGRWYAILIKAQTTCEAEVFRKGTFVLVR